MMNDVKEMMEARMNGINEELMKKGAKFHVEFTNNFKNNVDADGYNLIAEGKYVSPVIYYSDTWWSDSDEEIAEFLIKFNEKHKMKEDMIEIKECMKKDYILSHVLPKLYGNNNIEAMESHDQVYNQWLDMAIAYYVPIDVLSDDEGMSSVPVTNSIMISAGISEEEIKEAAILNMEQISVVKSMQELIGGMIPKNEICFEDMPEMIVVTSDNGINGAAGVLCKNVKNKLEYMLGNTFYILPSSIHECICVNADNEEYLHSMVCEVNQNEVMEIDKLTDSVYKYEDGEISKVA